MSQYNLPPLGWGYKAKGTGQPKRGEKGYPPPPPKPSKGAATTAK